MNGPVEFQAKIFDLQVRGDWVVVGLLDQILVYNFDSEHGLNKPIDIIVGDKRT